MHENLLISGGYDKIIRVFDLESCSLVRSMSGHLDLIRSLTVYRRDRPRVVSGSWDLTIRVWDLATGECLLVLSGHTNRLRAVIVCELTFPSGFIISGSDDNSMRAWDIESGDQTAEFAGHTHCVLSIAASLEVSPLVASGSTDCSVCVWELHSGAHLFSLVGHTFGVSALVFARPTGPQRPCLISASGDSTIRVWVSCLPPCHLVTGLLLFI